MADGDPLRAAAATEKCQQHYYYRGTAEKKRSTGLVGLAIFTIHANMISARVTPYTLGTVLRHLEMHN